MAVPRLSDTYLNSEGFLTNMRIGYFLFRITIGVNIFFHGFMRLLTGLGVWATPTAETFADTYLPMPLVLAFLYTLPFIEMILGAMMTLGLFTRWAMIGGSVMMIVLLYGNTARQNWGTAGNNMHYALYFWIMLALQHYDWLALDNRRVRNPDPG